MFLTATLKRDTDILRVYHDLYGYQRVNFSEEFGRHIIYFSGDQQVGRMVEEYLRPLSDQIAIQEEL